MDTELEALRQKHKHAQHQRQDEISALCTDLEQLLAHPPDTDILEKQAQTLDSLLRAVMRLNISAGKARGTFSTDHLHLALRIQKQCMDTIKTRAAIEYMNSLATPHTPKIEKQKEGS